MSAPNELDFLPDDYLAAKARAKFNQFFGRLLVVIIIVVAGAFAFAEYSLKQLRERHAGLVTAFEREATRIQTIDTLQKQQDAISRRAKLSSALVEKTPRTHLLDEITTMLPAGCSLLEVNLASKARAVVKPAEKTKTKTKSKSKTDAAAPPPEPEPKTYDVTAKIVGIAQTDVQVAQFIGSLGRSGFISEANLTLSTEFDFNGTLVRRFEVQTTLRDEPIQTAAID
jgi:Tfp pilus assembly protein PilN